MLDELSEYGDRFAPEIELPSQWHDRHGARKGQSPEARLCREVFRQFLLDYKHPPGMRSKRDEYRKQEREWLMDDEVCMCPYVSFAAYCELTGKDLAWARKWVLNYLDKIDAGETVPELARRSPAITSHAIVSV